jgi:hypothetical protein
VEEYTSIMKNDVWDIVTRLERKPMVISRWLYNTNHVLYGSIDNFKARFMERGFSQKEGVDYEETFSPITRYTSIRVVISLVSFMIWRINFMDVRTNFLNGTFKEEVYIDKLQWFELNEKESHVCKIKKTLYGHKKKLRAWYSRIYGYLQSMGFTKNKTYTNIVYLLGLICLFWCCM